MFSWLRADINQKEHRKRRRDAGILQVTERDITALSFIGQQYRITFDHLQTLLGRYSPAINVDTLSVGATRNALERWLQLGYIEPPRKVSHISENACFCHATTCGVSSPEGLTSLSLSVILG